MKRDQKIIRTGLLIHVFGSCALVAAGPPVPRLTPPPVELHGAATEPVSLNGTWKFSPEPAHGFWESEPAGDWEDIAVPASWHMQGHDVVTNTFAGYARSFILPDDWKGQRIKLRFGAVYSICRVHVNGRNIGAHEGGFTPFELDITDSVKFGTANTLALEVCNESDADELASGTKYACHPIGGIIRNVELFAVPGLNIADLYVRTDFDEAYLNAALELDVMLANEGTTVYDDASLAFSLIDPNGETVPLHPAHRAVGQIRAGETSTTRLEMEIAKPHHWNCETPRLYTLTCRLEQGGKVLETVTRRIGFREIEVKGTSLMVNGKPVKLRGINRHEAHPRSGRAHVAGLARKDVELFRGANVNLIRTCHYPADKELVEAADELGMFIEMEAPFCWAHRTERDDPARIQALAIQQTLEMVIRDRSNPSILMWSLANESDEALEPLFADAAKAVGQLDPSRPKVYNWMRRALFKNDTNYCEIATIHYPGYETERFAAMESRPLYLGEYAHLNAYNRIELATDQGLRDRWGEYLHRLWEKMYAHPTILGGSIWSGIDDTFFYERDGREYTIGYGTWGPIDGWRRKKPEWWGMKKSYSPVKVDHGSVKIKDNEVVIPVENRQDFSSLSRLEIAWKCGNAGDTVSISIPPKSSGELTVPLPEGRGDSLELTFHDPRGFMVDTFRIPLRLRPAPLPEPNPQTGYRVTESENRYLIQGDSQEYVIDKKTGQFIQVQIDDKPFALSGPHLMILLLDEGGSTQMTGDTPAFEPRTDPCSNWKLDRMEVKYESGLPVVNVIGSYEEAEGRFLYRFHKDGTFSIEHAFTVTREQYEGINRKGEAVIVKVEPRQLGIVFDLPREFEQLTWNRKGFWSTYPENHIARLEGAVKASDGYPATSVGPRYEPAHPWRLDNMTIGNNDFCATKHNVYTASLQNEQGLGLKLFADADKHSRCWTGRQNIHWLMADFSHAGAERFLQRITNNDRIQLKKGDAVSGTTRLQLIDTSRE